MPLLVDCVTTSRRLGSYGYRTLCIDIKVLESSPQGSVANRRLGSDGWGRYGDLCRCGLGRYGFGRYGFGRYGLVAMAWVAIS